MKRVGGSLDKNVLVGVSIDFDNEFMYFASERESIRVRRENGHSYPWTNDQTLSRYRFSNVFREDDRVSRFVYQWIDHCVDHDLSLFSNLTYARMCNKPSTLISTGLLCDADGKYADHEILLAKFLELGGKKGAHGRNQFTLWRNAYQVPGNFKSILGYDSREQLIAQHIPKTMPVILERLTKLGARVQLSKALDPMNEVWGYNNNFVFTQVLLDVMHVRPDIVCRSSRIPMNTGVQPLVIALKADYEVLVDRAMRLWNDANERKMLPKDAEHALCEFRKYAAWSRGLNLPSKLYKHVA